MDHKKSFIKGALSGALIMLLIVILGSGVWKAATVRMAGGEAEAAQISAESETDKKLNMLSNVIDQYYLYGDDIDEKAMQDGIYKGYASGLGDPYTVYYNEEQTRSIGFNNRGIQWDRRHDAAELPDQAGDDRQHL